MKFNFWQILGVVLLVIGLIGVLYNRTGPETPPDAPGNSIPPATQPTTAPTSQPLLLPVVP